MTKDDASILMMIINAYADWGGVGTGIVILAILGLWMGQAWLSVVYE